MIKQAWLAARWAMAGSILLVLYIITGPIHPVLRTTIKRALGLDNGSKPSVT